MKDILNSFAPISLEEMRHISLMNRTDTKFVTTMPRLLDLLNLAKSEYRVQEIDGKRLAGYYSLYLDTEDYDMYLAHLHGHANRQKLRIRSYVDSGKSFLEIKTKNNHKRTRKERMATNLEEKKSMEGFFTSEEAQFVHNRLVWADKPLRPAIENNFDRITLVNNLKTERLTIDFNLCFHNIVSGRDQKMQNIVIVELKRDGLAFSPILESLRLLRIKPLGFSKYCIGTALTQSILPQNRFMPNLHKIDKMIAQG